MSSLTVEEDQKWVPTHVQVTVLRGRGLRGKGKHGTSDVYTIIQLGKEKYSTCVAEKTTEPEWREECSFELQPGVLESGSNELVLTVMHRALIGMDVFLGQAVVHLDKVFNETRCVKNEWYRLNSKTGKKEKERGDIQVTILFTRNNLTASMYDLVMKEKGASTFGKLKERMKGKRRSSDEDSSSAVLPGGYGSLYRMRQRLPSDGGGEEEYEDDEGGEARRSKMRTFFLRGKLRKSSDTRSSTSLGSESSESSSRGGSLSPTAGISVVVSDLSNSPSNSSNLTVDNSPEHTADTSPKLSPLKSEFGDEPGEITIAVPQPTVCVNGSHAYNVQPLDPGSGKPAGSLGLGLLQKSLPLSVSLQNLSPQTSEQVPKGSVGDGRRWSFDKPGEEEKAAIAAALEQSGPMVAEDDDEQLGLGALPKAASSSSSVTESEIQGKKQKRNLFSHGRSESAGKGQSQSRDESEQASAATEEKHRGWFGSKDSHSKPSLVVSPKLEPSTNPHPPNHPPLGPPIDAAPLVSPLHHTNPFCPSQSTSPPMSPCNPFFSLAQQNPFYKDMLTAQPLNPSLPPLPYLSSARPPIAQLFPQASNTNTSLRPPSLTTSDSITLKDARSETRFEKRPLPPVPVEGESPLSQKLSNPFVSARELEPDSEWDEGFEAFAAGRLLSPEDLTTDCKTQQNTPDDHPLEHCNNKGASVTIADTDDDANVNDALQHHPCTGEFVFEAHKSISQVANTNMHHFDIFASFLETIPEHTSFERDQITSNTPESSPNPDACTETNEANITTNTNELTDTNMQQAQSHTSSVKLNSSSPDPGSSGLGSSAEEDFLSCVSSHSDKFSASSSEEADAQISESNILCSEKPSKPAVVKRPQPSDSEDDVIDKFNDLSTLDEGENTFTELKEGDAKVEMISSEGSLVPHSPEVTLEAVIPEGETGNEDAVTQQPKLSEPHEKTNSNENGQKSIDDFNESPKDLPKVLQNSSVSVNNLVGEMISMTPNDELWSTNPALNIITSSPEVRHSLTDSPVDRTAEQIPFELDFLNTSPIAKSSNQGFSDTLLTTGVSHQSSSSFLQSLYVSTESQHYQTCKSQQSSNNTSDLDDCVGLRRVETVEEDTTTACRQSNEENNQTEQFEGSICGTDDKTLTLEPNCMVDDFGLKVLAAASTDSYMSYNLRSLIEGGAINQSTFQDDVFSKFPQTRIPPLHRCHSEGTLTSAFDQLLLPSFGSDPGAIQDSSLATPGPDLLPSLTSFAPPSLNPDSSSSPVALCSSFPAIASASAWPPPSMAQVAAPMPTPQETQHHTADCQQNSPHPVKPLTTAMLAEEKRTEGRSVLATGLEKLKSTIHPGRSSQLSEQETDRKKPLTEGAGSYYHLNHSELVALLVQREAELERQKAEFERQKFLLAKREVELKKLKPQVRDLEDYIDTLLVRIMEQKPTLLQVRSKLK